jgi:hypothetical protein
MNGAFASKLVDLTDRIGLREVWEGRHEGPGAPDVAKLARLIGAYAPHDGRFALDIPGVYAIRASQPNTEVVHTV